VKSGRKKYAHPKKGGWEDHYSRQAKKERYPARSVYKLKEIQRKYNLLKSGDAVLDLGCYPGSWLLYAAEVVGSRGRVSGIDLKQVSVELPGHVRVHTGDIRAIDGRVFKSIGTGYNVVLSDLAPSTTGSRITDAERSIQLCRASLRIARSVLVRGGSFVCKMFQGEDSRKFSDSVSTEFNQNELFKPQSSRKTSREIYVIGLGRK
jgi:23S rRNA (uridine2552-2'-O)-methyltransferase